MNVEQLIKDKIKRNKSDRFLRNKDENGVIDDKHVFFPEKVIWKALIQSLIALEHIHSKNIIHRDIKSANILLHFENKKTATDWEKEIKDTDLEEATFLIADFNISTESLTGFQKTMSGTPFYASPEMLLR